MLVDADSYLANPILAAAINERYGVPIVKTVEEAKKIAYEVGREVPKELRPELAEREDEVAQLRSQYRAHSASVQQMSNAMQRMAGSMQSTKVATTTNPFWTGTITEATREYTPSFGTRFAREFDRLEDFVLAQSPPIGFPMFMALLMTFPIWLPLMALVALVHNPKP